MTRPPIRPWWSTVRTGLQGALSENQRINLLLRLTLIFHLGLFPTHASPRVFPVFFLSVLGLASARVLRHPLFWAAVVAVFGFYLIAEPVGFTSKYLNFYWCLAIFIALLPRWDTERVLALNARLLVGLVFLQAFLWKAVIYQDFLKGDFVRFSLLFCFIFTKPVAELGLIDPAVQAANMQVWTTIADMDGPVPGLPITEPAVITASAWVITVWTLFIEGLVGLVFLVPAHWRLAQLRHPALLAFMLSVYSFVPAWVFGGQFCAMGLALCSGKDAKWQPAYAATFFILAFLEWGSDIPKMVELIRLALH